MRIWVVEYTQDGKKWKPCNLGKPYTAENYYRAHRFKRDISDAFDILCWTKNITLRVKAYHRLDYIS